MEGRERSMLPMPKLLVSLIALGISRNRPPSKQVCKGWLPSELLLAFRTLTN